VLECIVGNGECRRERSIIINRDVGRKSTQDLLATSKHPAMVMVSEPSLDSFHNHAARGYVRSPEVGDLDSGCLGPNGPSVDSNPTMTRGQTLPQPPTPFNYNESISLSILIHPQPLKEIYSPSSQSFLVPQQRNQFSVCEGVGAYVSVY
jgi:hypothetical protein